MLKAKLAWPLYRIKVVQPQVARASTVAAAVAALKFIKYMRR